MNFTRLRYIAERSIKDEYLFAVTIDENPGSLQKLCNLLNNNNISEFNYRYNRKDKGIIFIGILTDNKDDLFKILSDNYNILDISDNKLAKDHTRYQICGNYSDEELIYTFEFPEKQGALTNFLEKMSEVSNLAEIIIGKHRHGPTGNVMLEFEPMFTKFRDTQNS